MFITNKKIIVASNSPRRQQFFKDLGIQFEVLQDSSEALINMQDNPIAEIGILGCDDLEERPKKLENPTHYAVRMANKKAFEALQKLDLWANPFSTTEHSAFHDKGHLPMLSFGVKIYALSPLKAYTEDFVIICADTIVTLGDEIFGKPQSHEEALAMLRSLSGRSHVVTTAVSIVDSYTKRVYSFFDSTKVHFAPWSSTVLKAYIDKGECLDKAGAYGISGLGAFLSHSIQGSWDTVVGLPVSKCIELLLWNNAITIEQE